MNVLHREVNKTKTEKFVSYEQLENFWEENNISVIDVATLWTAHVVLLQRHVVWLMVSGDQSRQDSCMTAPITHTHTLMNTHTYRDRETSYSNQVSVLNCLVTRRPPRHWPALPHLPLWAYVCVSVCVCVVSKDTDTGEVSAGIRPDQWLGNSLSDSVSLIIL